MRINDATLDLVKRFEGLRLDAYKDPVGIVTIGYGYTNRAGFGPGVKMGDRWTEQMAEEMLREGLDRFGAQIQKGFTRAPNENQYGAFVSLAYNIGPGAFLNSTALKRFNAGDDEGAAEALTWFNKAGGKVLNGLVRRRAAEKALFLEGAPVITQPDLAETSGGFIAAIVAALLSIFGKGKA
jgi:lysozyme